MSRSRHAHRRHRCLPSATDVPASSTSLESRIVNRSWRRKGWPLKSLTIQPSTRLHAPGSWSWGILALIAEFENDIRRERQMDGIAKARDRGVKFGRKPQILPDIVKEIQSLRTEGVTVPQIMRQTKLSRASIYRALGRSDQQQD